MILNRIQHVVDCPICSRPLEMLTRYLDREIACGHCRGHFTVHESPNHELSLDRRGGGDTLQQAESLLRRATSRDEVPGPQPPTVLLVEHRDEVFARIATDLAACGTRVIRAASAADALKLCGRYEPTWVIANVDLPDQSGWLLAGKLRFVDRRLRIWLYQPRSTSYDQGVAHYLRVDELLDYGGDLLGLSDTLIECMAQCQAPGRSVEETGSARQRAAA